MTYILTVKEISNVCGVSQSTIRRWIEDYELSQKEKFSATIENVEKMGNDHGVGPRMSGNLISHYALMH